MKIKLLLISIMLLSFNTVADNKIPENYLKYGPFHTGIIESLVGTKLTFDDEYFVLSPTIKFSTINKEKASKDDFKVGDLVALKMIKINNTKYVDHIYRLPKESR